MGSSRPASDICECVGAKGAPLVGLVLHGYGGDRFELLELAEQLAIRLRVRVLVPDLPGHGDRAEEPLTLASALADTEAWLGALDRPGFVVGHSMGARLALLAEAPVVAALSLPGQASFEGSPREMLRTLRANRVNESARYAGLLEVLAAPVVPAPATLLLVAEFDIPSVQRQAAEWGAEGAEIVHIPGTDHATIVEAPVAIDAVAHWLEWLIQ